MSDDAYTLLARPIQHALWDMRWESLRPIQVDAINEILLRENDVIISARTAAGKTEAAFLPILSRIYDEPQPSVQAIYVGPLKALINDQFRRLDDLCARAGIAVHRWHGDVDLGKKRGVLNKPSGVLLITPESIESLFINRSTMLTRLFRHLSFVVIDEIHALVGSERGTHLRSLLYRLRDVTEDDFRIAGLSATLGESFGTYAEWLRPEEPERVRLIEDAGERKQILYKIYAYASRAQDTVEEDRDEEDMLPPGIVEEMYEHLIGQKNLVFANTKQDVEWFADSLNRRCRALSRADEFLVHHGSLSKEMREFTEREMQGRRPQTTVCSSSLELGIDIGNVTAVGQVDPPWSVNSLVQRIGRSGRGDGEAQCMRLYLREQRTTEKTPLEKRFYPGLLSAIACTELMLEQPCWVEPPSVDALDLSTMTQQILSVVAETGGTSASDLYRRLVSEGAFRQVDQSIFTGLLRSLAAHDLIEQMDGGDIILSPHGETIVNHYSFYSAFATPIEYAVVHGSRSIGTLPAKSVPRPGDRFILGGRRWQAVEIDDERREILVQPAAGRRAPRFLGAGGEVHARVRQEMRNVLLGSKQYAYLNQTAASLLQEARDTAQRVKLSSSPLIELGDGTCMWFTWTGTKVQRTLCLFADSVGLSATDRDIAIEFNSGVRDVLAGLAKTRINDIGPTELASRMPTKQRRKFDEYVSDELLTMAIGTDSLDLNGAAEKIRGLLERTQRPNRSDG